MLLYLSLLISYLRHRFLYPDMILVGAECRVRWSWEVEEDTRIISFAPEPVDNSPFDEYGWSDDVFFHLPNTRGLVGFIRHGKRKGHEFSSANLIYADLVE